MAKKPAYRLPRGVVITVHSDPYNKDLRIKKNRRTIFSDSGVDVEETSISCGVHQLSNLLENDDFREAKIALGSDFTNVMKEAYRRFFTEIKRNRCAFLTMSNYIRPEATIINRVLGGICPTKSTIRTNPNSGNRIKIWIF